LAKKSETVQDAETVVTAETAAGAVEAQAETAGKTTAEPATETAAPVTAKNESASGVWCYIGPNVKGVIMTGTLYLGTRAEALEQAARAITIREEIKLLIVSGEELAAARAKVRTSGNALFTAYQKLKK
jgi:hypothetical protein